MKGVTNKQINSKPLAPLYELFSDIKVKFILIDGKLIYLNIDIRTLRK